MFGPKLNSVFASRWKALWWSAIVLATAYCTVPDADDGSVDDAAHSQKQDEATAKLIGRLTGQLHKKEQAPANPWALHPDC